MASQEEGEKKGRERERERERERAGGKKNRKVRLGREIGLGLPLQIFLLPLQIPIKQIKSNQNPNLIISFKQLLDNKRV